MHRFKVGQKVVAIINGAHIKKDKIYTVSRLLCCPNCGFTFISVEEITTIINSFCGACNHNRHKDNFEPHNCSEKLFAPLQNNADAVEYKLKVSIPELTEIKELQNQ